MVVVVVNVVVAVVVTVVGNAVIVIVVDIVVVVAFGVKDWRFKLPTYEKHSVLWTMKDLTRDFKRFAILRFLQQVPKVGKTIKSHSFMYLMGLGWSGQSSGVFTMALFGVPTPTWD